MATRVVAKEMFDGDPLFISILGRGSNLKTWRVKKRIQQDDLTPEEKEVEQGLFARYKVLKRLFGAREAREELGMDAQPENEVLALMFDAERFDVEQATKWMAEHGLETANKMIEDGSVLRVDLGTAPDGTDPNRLVAQELAPGVGSIMLKDVVRKEDAPEVRLTEGDFTGRTRLILSETEGEIVSALKSGDVTTLESVVAGLGGKLASLAQANSAATEDEMKPEDVAAIVKKALDEALNPLSVRLKALEATKKQDETPAPVVAAPETPAATPAAPETPAEPEVTLKDIVGEIKTLGEATKQTLGKFEDRLEEIESRVAVRKGYSETVTIESANGKGGTFDSVLGGLRG